jgi:hypothetical protein
MNRRHEVRGVAEQERPLGPPAVDDAGAEGVLGAADHGRRNARPGPQQRGGEVGRPLVVAEAELEPVAIL